MIQNGLYLGRVRANFNYSRSLARAKVLYNGVEVDVLRKRYEKYGCSVSDVEKPELSGAFHDAAAVVDA